MGLNRRKDSSLIASSEGNVPFLEIEADNLPTEEIQAKEAINARTRRECVCQHREVIALLAHRSESRNDNTGSKFHAAARSDLDPIGRQ